MKILSIVAVVLALTHISAYVGASESAPSKLYERNTMVGYYGSVPKKCEIEKFCVEMCSEQKKRLYRFKFFRCECLTRFKLRFVCPIGQFGPDCSMACHCKNQEPCNVKTGYCPNGCHRSYSGRNCVKIDLSHLAVGCSRGEENATLKEISECRYKCSAQDMFTLKGGCKCEEERVSCRGEEEQYTVCPRGLYGYRCSKVCKCIVIGGALTDCNKQTGLCRKKCEFAWYGKECDTKDVAFFKMVYASSVVSYFNASLAVDSNEITPLYTQVEDGPSWLVVDLRGFYKIHKTQVRAVVQTIQVEDAESVRLTAVMFNDKSWTKPDVNNHNWCGGFKTAKNGIVFVESLECIRIQNEPAYRFFAVVTDPKNSLMLFSLKVFPFHEEENTKQWFLVGYYNGRGNKIIRNNSKCFNACRAYNYTAYKYEKKTCECLKTIEPIHSEEFHEKKSKCPHGLYTPQCDKVSHCKKAYSLLTGFCREECHEYYYGDLCDKVKSKKNAEPPCVVRIADFNKCRQSCQCQGSDLFSFSKGVCMCEDFESSCKDKFGVCPSGLYGYGCSKKCPAKCGNGNACHFKDGKCMKGCGKVPFICGSKKLN